MLVVDAVGNPKSYISLGNTHAQILVPLNALISVVSLVNLTFRKETYSKAFIRLIIP